MSFTEVVFLFRHKLLLLPPKPSLADVSILPTNNNKMRHTYSNTVRVLSLLALTAGLTACETQNCTECIEEERQPSTLTLSLDAATVKSTDTPVDAEDNAINTVDVFIFTGGEESSPGYGLLDTYCRFEGTDIMEIRTTTGPKKICAIVNAKSQDLGSITALSQLKETVASLQDETFGNLTMYGEQDMILEVQTNASITVSRLISRVTVSSVRTRFAGTPYEGVQLSNCKVYLINAHADKLLAGGNATAEPLILNQGSLVHSDMESLAQPDMLADDIIGTIGDAGYTTKHYLHCYSNGTSDIPASTKLVLQADINGTTYYYPIPVNQEGYGHISENGHYGIQANTVYSYGITVTRPGSLQPDIPIEPGTLELSIDVAEWTVIPEFNKEF